MTYSGWIEDEPLWTAEEVAAEVGVEVQTIYTWVSRGYLRPAGTKGRHRLFRLEDAFEAEAARKRKHRKKENVLVASQLRDQTEAR